MSGRFLGSRYASACVRQLVVSISLSLLPECVLIASHVRYLVCVRPLYASLCCFMLCDGCSSSRIDGTLWPLLRALGRGSTTSRALMTGWLCRSAG